MAAICGLNFRLNWQNSSCGYVHQHHPDWQSHCLGSQVENRWPNIQSDIILTPPGVGCQNTEGGREDSSTVSPLFRVDAEQNKWSILGPFCFVEPGNTYHRFSMLGLIYLPSPIQIDLPVLCNISQSLIELDFLEFLWSNPQNKKCWWDLRTSLRLSTTVTYLGGRLIDAWQVASSAPPLDWDDPWTGYLRQRSGKSTQ